MSFLLNEQQQLLQQQVRKLFAERAGPDSLRALITDNQPWDRELWQALGELGLLGASIPEAYGGVGLGAVEVGIIAEEVGRAVAPVPFFSSICLAAEALIIAGTEAQKQRWLPKLASGEVVGTLAWTERPTAPSLKFLEATFEGGRLTGRKTPVPDAAIAQVCIVAAMADGEPVLTLVALDQPGVQLTPLKGIDQLRQQAQIDFIGARAELMNAGSADALSNILDHAAIYEAFEQVGGAEAAMLMARDHVMERYMFGRKLASFQAVKHSLANIFAMHTLAKYNALYAARALAEDLPDIRAAAATARLGATRAYEVAARENLQLHGGIGFTWEANCHFHYRRARLLALNLGSVDIWTDRLAEALNKEAAPRRESPKASSSETQTEPPEDAAYRAAARAWLAQHGPSALDIKDPARRAKHWTARKYEAGYSAIAHPKEFGGAGGARRQAQIFAFEEAQLGLSVQLGPAFPMAMAAIEGHGTLEQRRRWETQTYSGQIYWCQLFSEPAAGSDLAAVRTKSVKQGEYWIVNGQKVWTSSGDLGDYAILLARTDPDAPKHAGLSFFVIDMRQPGVTTRPIRQINGQTGFTETFLTDAVVPDANRLGAEGQGWAVAMTVLARERTYATGSIGDSERRTSPTSARSLFRRAREAKRDDGTAFDNAAVRARIAQWHVEAQGIKNFTLRLRQQLAQGGPSPLELPVLKLVATNRAQQIAAFLMDLDEVGGTVQDPNAPEGTDRFMDYLSAASARIAGGADEVLRNQIAERALGMPGEVRSDRDVPFSQLPY